MTDDWDEIRERTFTEGSIADAENFFRMCIHNAFPTMMFRELMLTHLLPEQVMMKGKRAMNGILRCSIIGFARE